MIINPTDIPGAYLVELQPRQDERGFFARSWCAREFSERGLEERLAQCNISFNDRRGTLRGMHYQADPFPEAKLVRCTHGSIFDVVLDLRPGSPTYLAWRGFELTRTNRRALYVPAGCAHGFQSLEDETEVLYNMSEFFHPEQARGVRWNDPAFRIRWPLPQPILSARDAGYPDFQP